MGMLLRRRDRQAETTTTVNGKDVVKPPKTKRLGSLPSYENQQIQTTQKTEIKTIIN